MYTCFIHVYSCTYNIAEIEAECKQRHSDTHPHIIITGIGPDMTKLHFILYRCCSSVGPKSEVISTLYMFIRSVCTISNVSFSIDGIQLLPYSRNSFD